MVATRNASGLPSHHVEQSLKTSGVACVGVWPAVVFHPLEHGVHPLPHHQPVHQVDKIKVGQLTVKPKDLDIDYRSYMFYVSIFQRFWTFVLYNYTLQLQGKNGQNKPENPQN